MIEVIVMALMLTLLSAPLVFGLQRFGVFRPGLWKVFGVCVALALLLHWVFGDEANFYFGYFIALPLLVAGVVVLAASFFMKRSGEGKEHET
jgi:hypothetical protein